MLFPKHENVSAACRFTFLHPYILGALMSCARLSAPLCRVSYLPGGGSFLRRTRTYPPHTGSVQPGPFFKMAPLAEIRHHPKTKIVYDFMSPHNCTFKFAERKENEQSFPSLWCRQWDSILLGLRGSMHAPKRRKDLVVPRQGDMAVPSTSKRFEPARRFLRCVRVEPVEGANGWSSRCTRSECNGMGVQPQQDTVVKQRGSVGRIKHQVRSKSHQISFFKNWLVAQNLKITLIKNVHFFEAAFPLNLSQKNPRNGAQK